jgi:hypothetical protein
MFHAAGWQIVSFTGIRAFCAYRRRAKAEQAKRGPLYAAWP